MNCMHVIHQTNVAIQRNFDERQQWQKFLLFPRQSMSWYKHEYRVSLRSTACFWTHVQCRVATCAVRFAFIVLQIRTFVYFPLYELLLVSIALFMNLQNRRAKSTFLFYHYSFKLHSVFRRHVCFVHTAIDRVFLCSCRRCTARAFPVSISSTGNSKRLYYRSSVNTGTIFFPSHFDTQSTKHIVHWRYRCEKRRMIDKPLIGWSSCPNFFCYCYYVSYSYRSAFSAPCSFNDVLYCHSQYALTFLNFARLLVHSCVFRVTSDVLFKCLYATSILFPLCSHTGILWDSSFVLVGLPWKSHRTSCDIRFLFATAKVLATSCDFVGLTMWLP